MYFLSASQPPQASTPYSLESESLGMECMISGSASPTLAINTVTNKVLQPAIQPPAPTHTWLHGCTLTPPTSPTTYSTIPHRERSTLVEGRYTHTHKHTLICLKLLCKASHTKIHNYLHCSTFFPLQQQQQAAGSYYLQHGNMMLTLILSSLQPDRPHTVP